MSNDKERIFGKQEKYYRPGRGLNRESTDYEIISMPGMNEQQVEEERARLAARSGQVMESRPDANNKKNGKKRKVGRFGVKPADKSIVSSAVVPSQESARNYHAPEREGTRVFEAQHKPKKVKRRTVVTLLALGGGLAAGGVADLILQHQKDAEGPQIAPPRFDTGNQKSAESTSQTLPASLPLTEVAKDPNTGKQTLEIEPAELKPGTLFFAYVEQSTSDMVLAVFNSASEREGYKKKHAAIYETNDLNSPSVDGKRYPGPRINALVQSATTAYPIGVFSRQNPSDRVYVGMFPIPDGQTPDNVADSVADLMKKSGKFDNGSVDTASQNRIITADDTPTKSTDAYFH